jgi:hypothetical protein
MKASEGPSIFWLASKSYAMKTDFVYTSKWGRNDPNSIWNKSRRTAIFNGHSIPSCGEDFFGATQDMHRIMLMLHHCRKSMHKNLLIISSFWTNLSSKGHDLSTSQHWPIAT